MQAAVERPPYVRFVLKPVEDRNESLKAGHYVARDEIFAIITPQGSKDLIERKATEWLEILRQQVAEQRYQPEWLRAHKEAFEAFKADRGPPLNGTSIKMMTMLSPSQVEALMHLRIVTVEDLAAANEETISRIGMGGRALKQKAIEWLEGAKNGGKQTEEIVSLKVANDELKRQNEKLQAQLTEVGNRLSLLEQAPPGKPAKL